jgi:hypothetical protein
MMYDTAHTIRRNDDGSIDYAYYKEVARELRRAQRTRLVTAAFKALRRHLSPQWRTAARPISETSAGPVAAE